MYSVHLNLILKLQVSMLGLGVLRLAVANFVVSNLDACNLEAPKRLQRPHHSNFAERSGANASLTIGLYWWTTSTIYIQDSHRQSTLELLLQERFHGACSRYRPAINWMVSSIDLVLLPKQKTNSSIVGEEMKGNLRCDRMAYRWRLRWTGFAADLTIWPDEV